MSDNEAEVTFLKIILNFNLDKNFINLDYRRVFVSYLKSMFLEIYPEKYKFYYESGAKTKPFCFDVKFNNPRFLNDRVEVEQNNVTFTIGTFDVSEGIDMYNGFLRLKKKKYPLMNENQMTLTDVKILTHRKIKSGCVFIKMLQPLAVRLHNKNTDKYFLFNEEGFENVFKKSVNIQLKNAGFEEDESIAFSPVNASKIFVKTMGGKIPANIGTYILKAEPFTINYLYQSGMCSRRSAGFSVFEVIKEYGEV